MTPWKAAQTVVETLKAASFEAFIVGGAVRDHLLGQAPESIEEFDVATAARPEDVEKLFRKTVPVGKAFGVIRVGVGRQWLEVATFRTEADYRDGRHPEQVRFATAAEDVERRDFTVNGLLWDPTSGKVLDYVGGLHDLERRAIRAIGDPDARFQEDSLRLLRAIRFGSRGDFHLEEKTEAAVVRHRERLSLVSPERIHDEFVKMATKSTGRRSETLRLLHRTGLLAVIFPDANLPADLEPAASILDGLKQRMLEGFLAVIFRNSLSEGAPPKAWRELAERIGARLRCSTSEALLLGDLLAGRARYRRLPRPSRARVSLAATREDAVVHEDLLHAEADATSVLNCLSDRRREGPSTRPPPFLDGRSVLALGVKPGRTVGWMMRRLRVLQLEGQIQSSEDASNYVRARLDRHL